MNKAGKTIENYYYGFPDQIADKILFIKREKRLAEYKAYLTNVVQFGNVWAGVTGNLRGEHVSIVVTGIGPGQVGDAVYALDKPGALCLYSGTCGGLNGRLEIGDYFLAEEAICADGCSYLFGREMLSSICGEERILNTVRAAFGRMELPHSRGLSFTTSSVVRENDPDFWRYVSPKCQAIEMGAAAFYAAAARSQKRAAAYFWVTDLPDRGRSFFDPLSDEEIAVKQARYEGAVETDLFILSSL